VLFYPELTVMFLTLFLLLDRQRSTLTDERIEGYAQMIQRATAGFEDRLERIDGRLEILVDQTVARTGPEAAKAAAEVHQIQEERASTEKYMQICTQLLEHINQLRLAGRRGPGSSTASETDFVERIANEGLDECAESISRMASKLASHEKNLFNRLAKAMTGSGTSARDEAEIARLRSEWESTRTQMEILTKAGRKLEETVSVIQNRATGNAIQVMVSADGKPIHGTNEGTGEWTRQVGGYMSNETIQQVMRDMLKMALATSEVEKAKASEKKAIAGKDRDEESSEDSKFEDLYGEGFTLACESPTGSTTTERRIK
jgi:regulator of replication initiation timing